MIMLPMDNENIAARVSEKVKVNVSSPLCAVILNSHIKDV